MGKEALLNSGVVNNSAWEGRFWKITFNIWLDLNAG